MSKIRLTVTLVREFEPNPEYYPGMNSIEEMAEFERRELLDVENLLEALTFTHFDITAKAEVIRGDKENG